MESSTTRRRGYLRSLLLAWVVGLSSVMLGVVAPSPAAAAGSLNGLAQNAWLVTEFAAEAQTKVAQSPEVTEWERQQAGAATTGTTGKPGVKPKPRVGGKIGTILNTLNTLGGIGGFDWGGGDEVPELPVPPPLDGYVGSQTWGWTNIPGAAVVGGHPTQQNWGVISVPWVPGQRWFRRAQGDTGNPGGQGFCQSVQACLAASYALGSQSVVHNYYTTFNDTPWNNSLVPVGVLVIPAFGVPLPNPNPGAETDPALVPRYIDSQITCKSASGAEQVINHREGPFMFDPANPATLPAVPDLVCPAGTWLSKGKRDLATEGSTETVPLVDLYDAPGWVPEQVGQFPDCIPTGPNACVLQVWQIGVGTNPDLDCSRYGIGPQNPCRDWYRDPQRRDKYACRFAGQLVALKRCTPLKDIFTVGVVTSTPTAPDEDLPPVPDAPPEGGPDDEGCVPTFREMLSPWWVFRATACALEWAFVPKTGLSTRVGSITTTMQGHVPFSWFADFAAIPINIPSDQCPNWRVKVGGENKHVLCGHGYTDSIRAARPVLLGMMALLALWPLIRSTMYAAFPVLKPAPGMLR